MVEYHLSSSLPRPLTRAILEKLGGCFVKGKRFEVGLRFVTEREIRKLNRAYRGFDRSTDVLSFSRDQSLDDQTREIPTDLGDIVVCPAFAKREALDQGVDFDEKLVRLIAHGTLHLLGYDHVKATERAIMFRMQEQCVKEVTI